MFLQQASIYPLNAWTPGAPEVALQLADPCLALHGCCPTLHSPHLPAWPVSCSKINAFHGKGQDQPHNLQGSVQSENSGLLVQK